MGSVRIDGSLSYIVENVFKVNKEGSIVFIYFHQSLMMEDLGSALPIRPTFSKNARNTYRNGRRRMVSEYGLAVKASFPPMTFALTDTGLILSGDSKEFSPRASAEYKTKPDPVAEVWDPNMSMTTSRAVDLPWTTFTTSSFFAVSMPVV